MNLLKHIQKPALVLGFLSCTAGMYAQNEFYNNGADVYIVGATALVYVQGEVINDDEGVNVGRIHNTGQLQLTGNWSNLSTVSNVFDLGASGTTTFLGTGAVQTIGPAPGLPLDTYFNNLTIQKSGGTTQELRLLRNSATDFAGVLNLTNDFLNTQTFIFGVGNPATGALGAIQRTGAVSGGLYNDVLTEGYVTSTPGSTGRLSRASSNLVPGALFFPVGNGTRFRPVEITPTSVGNNAYTVQFVNLPTFSTTLLAPTLDIVNPAWYHFLERQVAAGSPENIRIYHNFVADNVCDQNFVTIAQWNTALWYDHSPTTTTVNASPVLSWTQKAGYPGSYPTPWLTNSFALAGLFVSPGITSCVFPVELIQLSATPMTNSIMLDWATASEVNNTGFDVERSLDGVNFSKIGWVNGHGTTTSTHNYSLEDKEVQKDVVYFYRLRQVDINGTFTYSNMVQAMLTGDNSFQVSGFYPNPAENLVNLNIFSSEAGEMTVEFYNAIGQQIRTEKIEFGKGTTHVTFDTDRLSSGSYMVNFISGGDFATEKLVVKH